MTSDKPIKKKEERVQMPKIRNKKAGTTAGPTEMKNDVMNNFIPTSQATGVKRTDSERNVKHQINSRAKRKSENRRRY